jgi:hypothetical protein
MYYLQFFQDNIDLFNLLLDKFIQNFISNVFFIQNGYRYQINSNELIQVIKEPTIDPKYFDLLDFAIGSPKKELGQIQELNWNNLLSLQQYDDLIWRSQAQYNWISIAWILKMDID